MKVTLPKNYREVYTLEELEIARRIIRDMKEDLSKPAEYIEYAINHYLRHRPGHECKGWLREVIRATAETARSSRAWDAYGEGTRNMDVWIEAIAETDTGFLKIGAYLTDIWEIGGDAILWPRFWVEHYDRNE